MDQLKSNYLLRHTDMSRLPDAAGNTVRKNKTKQKKGGEV